MVRKISKEDRENSTTILREWLAPTKMNDIDHKRQTVYAILRHVSRSGMSRRISFVIVRDGMIRDITWHIGNVLGYATTHHEGEIMFNGCGMDMAFHVVYSLGSRLWPEGTPEPYGARNGEADSDGGYAIKHSWL